MMSNFRKIAITIVSLPVCFGFLSGDGKKPEGEQKAVYRKISAKQAKEMMDSGDPYILLDVRTEAEFAEIRIKGAILITNTEIRNRAGTELPDKNALIFVYCRSGGRSSGAAKELVSMGYTNVYDIGGIMNWPYETIRG